MTMQMLTINDSKTKFMSHDRFVRLVELASTNKNIVMLHRDDSSDVQIGNEAYVVYNDGSIEKQEYVSLDD